MLAACRKDSAEARREVGHRGVDAQGVGGREANDQADERGAARHHERPAVRDEARPRAPRADARNVNAQGKEEHGREGDELEAGVARERGEDQRPDPPPAAGAAQGRDHRGQRAQRQRQREALREDVRGGQHPAAGNAEHRRHKGKPRADERACRQPDRNHQEGRHHRVQRPGDVVGGVARGDDPARHDRQHVEQRAQADGVAAPAHAVAVGDRLRDMPVREFVREDDRDLDPSRDDRIGQRREHVEQHERKGSARVNGAGARGLGRLSHPGNLFGPSSLSQPVDRAPRIGETAAAGYRSGGPSRAGGAPSQLLRVPSLAR